MISSLLIANRGEISCRIIRTCRRLGIRAVAIYSDADALSLHVREADSAVHIGPAPAADSYLDGERIIAAALEQACEAIHPGYGFLSENAGFAQAVIDAGLVWVGPKPATIRAMGLKDEAKRIAEEAGVPVLPGYRGESQDVQTLASEAEKVGYPLLIKAVAGGGGRGIRLVSEAGELAGELESAVREAESAFGDGRVMLEKLVERPRHIEVQVFGDRAGNAVHLYERDCSLQRRRQKVVEEAPAPGMSEEVREAMTSAAVRLARSVRYEGAGTVEFIVDGNGALSRENFWFLEMNTRLQVEHPVTEMITGLDLVELQLRVASGEALGLEQEDIPMIGHAIEARICAEDPCEGFRPGAGRIEAFGPLDPPDGVTTRWDGGFEPGDRVPSNYDSMIAKLIVHGETREDAINAMAATLAHTQLVGVPGNIGFIGRCIVSQAFGEATHHVNWIAEQADMLTHVPESHAVAGLAAVTDILVSGPPGDDPWSFRDGWRLNGDAQLRLVLKVDGVISSGVARVDEDAPLPLVTDLSATRFAVTAAGDSFLIEVPDYEAEAEAVEGGDLIRAPMPGKLIALMVPETGLVEKGQPLAVMEAMKMEHTLASPRNGAIECVHVSAGDQLAEGEVLISLIAEDETTP